MFQVAEVVETKKAYKPNQKDNDGNTLPLGSIEVRLGGHSSLVGQVRNVFARPAVFNRRIPLIGEQVLVFLGPVHDHSARPYKNTHFSYLCPYNSTDDLVLHQFPRIWGRSKHVKGGGGGGSTLSDREKPGYTFPKNPKKVDNVQPFEGDDIIESRFGSSIRLSRTVIGNTSIYQKQPSWMGGGNGDPITILRVKKPTSPDRKNYNFETESNPKNNKYTIEDISKDEASLYLTTTQRLIKLRGGFTRNLDVIRLGTWSGGSQAVLNADRVVLNAQKDKAFLIGKDEVITTGKKVLLQSSKHKVDLDDLMEYINAMCKEMFMWATGAKQFATAMGPTLTATNVAEVTKLHQVDFNLKFKLP